MTEKSQTAAPSLAELAKSGLPGRCFIVRDDRGRTQRQGFVHCIIPSQQGDLVLVQYFEALMGYPNTMAIKALSDMVERDFGMGGYVFFQDDAHLRDYFETWQHARDERLDRLDREAANEKRLATGERDQKTLHPDKKP